jgi:hypothetical protein
MSMMDPAYLTERVYHYNGRTNKLHVFDIVLSLGGAIKSVHCLSSRPLVPKLTEAIENYIDIVATPDQINKLLEHRLLLVLRYCENPGFPSSNFLYFLFEAHDNYLTYMCELYPNNSFFNFSTKPLNLPDIFQYLRHHIDEKGRNIVDFHWMFRDRDHKEKLTYTDALAYNLATDYEDIVDAALDVDIDDWNL